MASTKTLKNNPYVLSSMDSVKFMQKSYFSTGTNNAHSILQKLEMINLICFLQQQMYKKDPEKFNSCLATLGIIFNADFNNVDTLKDYITFNAELVRAYGLICDDLLWGTYDMVNKPEDITNAKEIKDKIINYFTDEWSPF